MQLAPSRPPITLRVMQELRAELHLMAVRFAGAWLPHWRRRAAALRQRKDVALHFGCGPRVLPGWINIDGWRLHTDIDYLCDLRRPLPLADNSCELIFTEHVFEHIDREYRAPVLRELYRVLRPGGIIRIVVPDCAKFVDAYVRGDRAWFENAFGKCDSLAEGLNSVFVEHFHRFIDDFESLSLALRAVGFVDIHRSDHNRSREARLRVDLDEPSRIPLNLYVEARKSN